MDNAHAAVDGAAHSIANAGAKREDNTQPAPTPVNRGVTAARPVAPKSRPEAVGPTFRLHADQPRIAAFLIHEFPILNEWQASLHRQLSDVGDAIGAEVRVFHTSIPDPISLSAAAKAQLGTGFFVPTLGPLFADAAERVRGNPPADQLFAANHA